MFVRSFYVDFTPAVLNNDLSDVKNCFVFNVCLFVFSPLVIYLIAKLSLRQMSEFKSNM